MRQAVSEWAFHTSRLHRSLLRTAASDALNRANGALSFAYEHLPTVPPVASHSEVAVIIPVYDGLESTIDCVESVLTSENQTLRKVIIIDDCSPNQAIQAYLRDLEQQQLHDVVIIRRRTNGGFSEAVNLGIVAAQDRDVILLNSDTLVQNGWIDRLRAAAQSDSNIGTVTPLSNNAEITNVPYICRPMPMSHSALALRVDEKASEVNSRQIVDIPVAVGFCVYVKRSCIDEVGLFDSKTWGRGYGEEVDFCLKAVARGWRHVLALDTFVLHHGAISFGDEKKARIAESTKEINKRYPFYDAVIERFIRDDPARAARRKLNLSLIGAEISNRRVLHVTHGYGGGTNQYVSDQCEIERLDGWASMVLTFSASGEAHLSCTHSSSLLQGFLADNHVESYAQDELDSIKEDIHSLKISRVHLHSPFGLPLHFMDWLVRTYPTTITVHDYAWICPRVHLTQGSDRYCGEPNIEGCNQCVRIHGVHKDLQSFVENVGEDVALYRQAFQEILRKAEVVLTGAQDVVSRMERHGVTAKFKVLPYSHPPDSVFLKRANHDYPVQKGEAIRVALIGGISHGKGLGQLLRCADYASKNDLGVNFIIFGSTSDDAAVTNHRNITIVGAYTEEDLEALISRHRPHVAFFPYQWPETYSYTLSHAIRLNMRIVVTNIGAPAERVRDVPNATVISLTAEPKEMIEHLIQVARTGQSSKQV
jgi:GT2 family glycosyltransferase